MQLTNSQVQRALDPVLRELVKTDNPGVQRALAEGLYEQKSEALVAAARAQIKAVSEQIFELSRLC